MRATAQLAAVSLLIGRVAQRLGPLLGFLVLVFAVAAWAAGRRVTPDRAWWWAAVPIAAGAFPVIGLLPVTGLVPVRGRPSSSAGRSPRPCSGGRRAPDGLTTRYGEVEAYAALGLLDRDARPESVRPAASDALLPGLDRTRTVGLVTSPGAFVGMLLGGASPVEAGAVRLFVLVTLAAVRVVAVAVVLELVARGWPHQG
ncbi:ABC transporter permease [Streptomyces sp. NPDC018055]|uniref:ABC transporter permease n=1 Tax=unclassified Streptomyces TaxID=2593676 RepID=UPI0037BC5BEC